jgi:NDP-sugar pyrophosphorylase family protein
MVRLSYEPRLRGSAGALPAFSEWLDGPFYAMYGDVFTDTDLARLWEAHVYQNPLTTMLVHDRVDPTTGGMVLLDDETGRVRGLHEKPSRDAVVSPWVNAGVFVMDPAVLSYVPTETPSDIAHDLIPALLAGGERVHAVPLEDSAFLVDIGTNEALALARSIAKARR